MFMLKEERIQYQDDFLFLYWLVSLLIPLIRSLRLSKGRRSGCFH